MAINLGAAYVDIVPSTRSLGPQLQRQVVQPAAAAGDQAAAGFGSRFSSGISSFLGGVSTAVERTLGAAALAGAGLATVTFAKGWDRLTTIQDATASLTVTLGSAEEAAGLLNSVLDVVRGTPFNLDQFASAAQRLSGMGIEAQKIPGYLEAIGNAASLQGKNADDYVGRLVRVFGQVQAQGRITGEDINQFSETGVNALAILGNHFGVTSEQMRDMISRGAVPAGEALDALADGILNGTDGAAGATVALAGTMDALRGTLSGVTGGIGAALGRLGAGFLAPFTPALTESLNGVIDFLDDITPKATEFAQSIVDSPGFGAFTDWLTGLPDAISGGIGAIGDLEGVLGPVLGLLASFASKGLGGLPLIGGLIPVIGPFVGIVGGIIAASPELRDSLGGLLESLIDLGGAIVEAFTPVVDKILPVIETILGFGLEGATAAVDYITDLVSAFNESGIGGVWDKITTDWANAGPMITSSLDTAWSAVSTWVSARIADAPGLIGGLADSISEGFDTALNGDGDTPPLLDSMETAWGLLDSSTQQQQKDMEENIRSTWPTAFTSWVDDLINGNEAGPGIIDRLQGFTDSISTWIDNGGIQQLAGDGAKLAGAMIKGFVTVVVPGFITVIQNLAGVIIKAVAALAWMFIQIGASIATSIVKGLRDFLEDKVGDTLTEGFMAGLKAIPGAGGAISLADTLSSGIPGFASGGVAMGGKAAIVGEDGPELFFPSVTGLVVARNTLASWNQPVAGGDGGSIADGYGGFRDLVIQTNDVDSSIRRAYTEQRKQAVFAGGR